MLIGLLKSTEICYNSLNYFMECIEKTLNYNGIQTEWIVEFDENVLMKKWDAIVGINRDLPSIRLEDGTFFVDLLGCPIFDFLVDAPYYHHYSLESHTENLHVIVLDQGHVEYCRKYYSPLKSVTMACLLGPVAEERAYKDRKIDVLFSGWLPDMEEYKQKIHAEYAGKWQESLFEKLLEIGVAEPDLSTEQALQLLLQANGIEYSDADWKSLMNFFGVHSEFWLRGYYREKVISTLVNYGLNVHVVGGGWNKLYPECPSNLTVQESVEFAEVAKLTANAKIVLNVMPWFKDGMHDRILSAMMNGAVCVTDGSSYIKSHFVNGEDMIIYNLKEIDKLPMQIEQLLQNETQAQCIAERGKKKVFENYSWNKIVEENILKYLF